MGFVFPVVVAVADLEVVAGLGLKTRIDLLKNWPCYLPLINLSSRCLAASASLLNTSLRASSLALSAAA